MKAKARAAAKSVAKHRVFFLFVIGLFTVGLLAGSYAVQSTAQFSGQTQAGDHDWWTGFSYEFDNNGKPTADNQNFCVNCHTAIGTDIAPPANAGDPTGQHSSVNRSKCSFCHAPSGQDHAANASQCTDCHPDKADELNGTTEAHNGILTSLNEGNGLNGNPGASQTCQACHTHAEVAMTITADAAIPLKMGP